MAYTPPSKSAVDYEFVYDGGYTPPSKSAVDATFSEGPSPEAYSSAPGPLETSNDILIQSTDGPRYAYSSAPGPLETSNSIETLAYSLVALVTVPGPLELSNDIEMLGGTASAVMVVPGPLELSNSIEVLSFNVYGSTTVPGPLELSNSIQVVGYFPVVAQAVIPGPLNAQTTTFQTFHDFTTALDGELYQTYYTCVVEASAGFFRVPISSWQSTLQVGRQSYLQAVVPGADEYTAAIDAALLEGADFVVIKGARLPNGDVFEQQMSRAPMGDVSTSKGPTSVSVTISGYGPAFESSTDPNPIFDRTLTGLRSQSLANGTTRSRSDIDWLLQPAQRAYAGGIDYVVDYVNYYVNLQDSYMDTGSRG